MSTTAARQHAATRPPLQACLHQQTTCQTLPNTDQSSLLERSIKARNCLQAQQHLAESLPRPEPLHGRLQPAQALLNLGRHCGQLVGAGGAVLVLGGPALGQHVSHVFAVDHLLPLPRLSHTLGHARLTRRMLLRVQRVPAHCQLLMLHLLLRQHLLALLPAGRNALRLSGQHLLPLALRLLGSAHHGRGLARKLGPVLLVLQLLALRRGGAYVHGRPREILHTLLCLRPPPLLPLLPECRALRVVVLHHCRPHVRQLLRALLRRLQLLAGGCGQAERRGGAAGGQQAGALRCAQLLVGQLLLQRAPPLLLQLLAGGPRALHALRVLGEALGRGGRGGRARLRLRLLAPHPHDRGEALAVALRCARHLARHLRVTRGHLFGVIHGKLAPPPLWLRRPPWVWPCH
mmetsp:Transcript_104/g.211  ORF Transcript_104/g.211 Transcript_104/m.211 type:complete len:404 (-) Transcript_104:343-1554(-)